MTNKLLSPRNLLILVLAAWAIYFLPGLVLSLQRGHTDAYASLIGTYELIMKDRYDKKTKTVRFPQSGEFPDATAFFKDLISRHPDYAGDELFDEAGRARWCVVEGLSKDVPNSTPFLLYPNFKIETTDQEWTLDDIEAMDKMWWREEGKAIVLANKGGACIIMKKKALHNPINFNPTSGAYKILRP